MRTHKESGSTLTERVVLMIVLSSLSVSINFIFMNHLDGRMALPEYAGMFLGGFILTPLSTFILSSFVYLFVYVSFGISGRKPLHKIWIITMFTVVTLLSFAMFLIFYEHKVWQIVFEYWDDGSVFSLAMTLIAILSPAFFVFISSFLLTEEWYLFGLDCLNDWNENA